MSLLRCCFRRISHCPRLKHTLPNKKFLVPQTPVKSKIDPGKLPPRTRIDAGTIALLERLSLVDCANRQGIETLEEAVAFADQILQVDTTDIEPLVTVLEDRPLRTRDDRVCEGGCRGEVLRNAAATEEDYFVAPPGNIPLEARDNLLYDESEQDNKVGPVGALLQHNLFTEWFNSLIINKDLQVFPNPESDITDTVNFAKDLCLDVLPFGVTQITNQKQDDANTGDFASYFRNSEMLECRVFLNPANSMQFFQQWQRERRVWWRKFSISPGRYATTDMKNGDGGAQVVDILATHPCGDQLVERLSLFNDENDCSSESFQVKDGKKTIQAHYAISRISSSTMLLNTLCDAYDEPQFQEKPRPMLRLHRRLAPYKISFSIPTGLTKAIMDELKDLALYLCRQLRKNRVSCLYVPSSYRHTLGTQWKQYDRMGVPYNVVLNADTLKTGLAHLRSRDTTLKEQIHVTDLPTYVEQLFKNY